MVSLWGSCVIIDIKNSFLDISKRITDILNKPFIRDIFNSFKDIFKRIKDNSNKSLLEISLIL